MMKLRNKKTGEIVEICKICPEPYEARDFGYSSLAELCEDWEDYKEPKEWWFIDCTGFIKHGEGLFSEKSYIKDIQAIGNYFTTKEDAEKAVEKLKAWKRLKDNGFRFDGWEENHHNLEIIEFGFDKVVNNVWDFEKELDLLFGGGDED